MFIESFINTFSISGHTCDGLPAVRPDGGGMIIPTRGGKTSGYTSIPNTPNAENPTEGKVP